MFRNEVITLAAIITNPFENGNASISCCAQRLLFFCFIPPRALCLMYVIWLIYCQIALMRLFHSKWRSSSPESQGLLRMWTWDNRSLELSVYCFEGWSDSHCFLLKALLLFIDFFLVLYKRTQLLLFTFSITADLILVFFFISNQHRN